MAITKKAPAAAPDPEPNNEGKLDPTGDQGEYNEATASPEASVWEAVEKAEGFVNAAPGTYEAIINDIKVLPMNDKGRSIQVQSILVQVDDETDKVEGRKHSFFYKILEADGRTPAGGSSFFATFMAKLGYEKGDRGERAVKEIREEKPGVSLKLTANGQYPPNTAVNFRYEEDTPDLQDLREWLEANPV